MRAAALARNKINLFPLTKDEAKLLQGFLERALTVSSTVPTDFERHDQPMLVRIISVIKSGGLKVYAGSVADQEGDSAWEVSSSLRQIRAWAKDMSIMSYESPRTYRVSVKRSGFGCAKRLNWKPKISNW